MAAMSASSNSTPAYKVGIVVDRNYANRIPELARAFHVWVVESPKNSAAIQQFWAGEKSDAFGDPLETGITSFKPREGESAQALCAGIAEYVDEHHNAYAHDPPWSEIEVYGADLDDQLREVFSDLGATSFEKTEEGFVCRR